MQEHALRQQLHNEIHARPFERLPAPCLITHMAFLADPAQQGVSREHLCRLLDDHHLPRPADDSSFYSAQVGPVRLRWERHGEFVSYTFIRPGLPDSAPDWFSVSAAGALSAAWRQQIPGELLCAIHTALPAEIADTEDWPQPEFDTVLDGDALVASEAADRQARVYSDLRIHADGFARFVVLTREISARRRGRLVQRLLEIETYRMLALTGLPMAQRLGPSIRRIESELPALLSSMQRERGLAADRVLLDRLTALATELETGAAQGLFRLGATRAYHELVLARLDAIKESRIPHHSTLASFLARRLTPAIRTCATVEQSQTTLSSKIARIAELLRTRVDIELESQNADQIRQMAERVRLQLRLQQTVEGLSIAAITYYVSSVLHLLFEGAHGSGVHVDPAVATGAAVPVVFAVVAFIVWRIRHAHTE